MQRQFVFGLSLLVIAFWFSSAARPVDAQIASYLDLIQCAGHLNYACVLDKSEGLLRQGHQQLLAEADAEMAVTGRKKNSEETPSALIDSITNIFSEITNLFYKHGFGGFFRDSKGEDAEAAEAEADEDYEDDEQVETKTAMDEKKQNNSPTNRELKEDESEGRGKKKKMKKAKIKALIKLLLFAGVLYGKVVLLLKVLAAHLQLKFLAIAAAGLLINIARFYLDLKGGHHPQKVIYYEHAQHQHHYENEDDWGGGHNSGGYWGRSYEEEDKDSGANLAYHRHKPTESTWFKLFK